MSIVEKPVCKLVGEDGNAFNIIRRVKRCLEEARQWDAAQQFVDKAIMCESYGDVLILVHRYVEVE